MESLNSIILTALRNVEEGRSVKNSLRYLISENNLNREEESALYYYVYEIYRRLNLIDLYIKQSSSQYSLKKLNNRTKSLLRLATFMLKIEERSRIEVKASLSNFYDMIMGLEFDKILELINAVSEENILENRLDIASQLSITKFIPTWMVRNFLKKWDESTVKALLDSFLVNLPVYVRINNLKADPQTVLDSLQNHQIIYESVNEIKNLLEIKETVIPIPRLKEFRDGQIVIQQKASALVALILAPKENEQILDMCASPGGKTSHLAAIIGNGRNITALDINFERIKILQQRLKLLGVEEIEIKQQDARKFYEITNKKYDKILLDPPCSGSGTYSSRPENKWRLKQRDLSWYTSLQTSLLFSASKLIKPGGTIVYSTCSIFDEENTDIISSFLQKNSDFSLQKPHPILGELSKDLDNKAQEFYPHIHETEGFFIAKLKKLA